jgi:two-component system, OmpR family, phosphate regulon sensor histidine kinase PhoR
VCDARGVDALVIGFIIVQAVVLGAAIALAIVRGRTIGRLRELLAPNPTEADVAADPDRVDVEQAVRALLDRTRTAEWEASQIARDRGSLLDIIGVGIVRLDDELLVEVANAAAHQFLGRQAGSLIGRSAVEAFIDPAIEAVAETARQTGAASGELTLRRDDGPTLLVRARRSPVRGVWLIMEDVSELRRLQRIRTEFIDNLSHELRTPLTSVSLLAETLVREADAAGQTIPPQMRDRIGKIEVETDHLVQMVEELLDLSRIESGGPMLMLDEVDLRRLAVAAVERLRLFAERQGVDLRSDVPEAVPPIRGAEDRLGQVLVNLLHNAVKFSPDGGVVTVRVEPSAEEVVVSVEDHGIGIARADQARIFERFYKADKARRRGGGTGLGLAIARHVVEAHGGRIRVESEEGRGATFSFGIPTLPEDAA